MTDQRPEPGYYEVVRTFRSSVRAVWGAWTDHGQLAAWYHPVGMSVLPGSVTSDPVLGGRFSATVVVPADGSEHRFTGNYAVVEPTSQLAYTLFYEGPMGVATDMPGSRGCEIVTLTFRETPGGTELRYRQDGFLPAEQRPMAQAGMESYFDSLAAHLGE
jgi:uncharacterized protein YndB with AHSA1/START domain